MTDDKKRKKGIVISVYLGHDDSPRAQQLLGDIEQYAVAHGITHADRPAPGKAIRAILEQFFATDAARLEAGLTVECQECGGPVSPDSEWIEYQSGGVCCHECAAKAA